MEDKDYQVYISDVSRAMEELEVEIQEETESVIKTPKTEGPYSEIQNNEVIQREQSQAQALVSDEPRFWSAVAEPPDLDYRRMIADDQKNIDWILSDHDRHFEKRYLMYKYLDTDVEYSMMTKYSHWVVGKQGQAMDAKDERQAEFYSDLPEVVEEELRETEQQTMLL